MNKQTCPNLKASEISALRQNMKAVFRGLKPNLVVFRFWPLSAGPLVPAQKNNQSAHRRIDLLKAAKLHKSFTPNPRTPNFKKAYTAGGASRPVRGCFAHLTWLARVIQNQSTHPQP